MHNCIKVATGTHVTDEEITIAVNAHALFPRQHNFDECDSASSLISGTNVIMFSLLGEINNSESCENIFWIFGGGFQIVTMQLGVMELLHSLVTWNFDNFLGKKGENIDIKRST